MEKALELNFSLIVNQLPAASDRGFGADTNASRAGNRRVRSPTAFPKFLSRSRFGSFVRFVWKTLFVAPRTARRERLGQPSSTQIRCSWPSSLSSTLVVVSKTPSNSSRVTPRVAPRGLWTVISYCEERYLKLIRYCFQLAGMHGSMCRRSPRSPKPRIDSRPARYSQPLEPVYHVQPPRPTCGAAA